MSSAAIRRQLPILLIEDEPSVTAFLRAALERKGYCVEQANSHAGRSKRGRNTCMDSGEPAGVEGAHNLD
jgi:hypothetical protein